MMTERQKFLVEMANLTGTLLSLYRMGGIVHDLGWLSNYPVSFRRDYWDLKQHPQKYKIWRPKRYGLGA